MAKPAGSIGPRPSVYQRLNGRPLRSLLEIACGPGYHARAFAKHGVETVGLDLRPEMIEFARDKAKDDGVDVQWIAADMRGFALAHPVDAIITMYDSIDCLTDNDDIVDCYGDFVPGLHMDNSPASRRMIFVLQKQS